MVVCRDPTTGDNKIDLFLREKSKTSQVNPIAEVIDVVKEVILSGKISQPDGWENCSLIWSDQISVARYKVRSISTSIAELNIYSLYETKTSSMIVQITYTYT